MEAHNKFVLDLTLNLKILSSICQYIYISLDYINKLNKITESHLDMEALIITVSQLWNKISKNVCINMSDIKRKLSRFLSANKASISPCVLMWKDIDPFNSLFFLISISIWKRENNRWISLLFTWV
jgi:hypothetical protein